MKLLAVIYSAGNTAKAQRNKGYKGYKGYKANRGRLVFN
jgi:hypothetical protein